VRTPFENDSWPWPLDLTIWAGQKAPRRASGAGNRAQGSHLAVLSTLEAARLVRCERAAGTRASFSSRTHGTSRPAERFAPRVGQAAQAAAEDDNAEVLLTRGGSISRSRTGAKAHPNRGSDFSTPDDAWHTSSSPRPAAPA